MDRPTADIYEPYDLTDQLVKVGWNREHLTVGDFAIPTYENKIAGIERKEASDLLNSLASGRLAKQLQNLLNTYDYPIFLLEGSLGQSLDSDSSHSRISLNSGGETKWSTEAVRNFLLTWQLKGIVYMRTSSIRDTIERLNELVVYFSRPLHLGGLNKRSLGDERLMAFPSCVPIKQREQLLRDNDNIRNIANLTVEDLLDTQGIGQARAEAIYNFYHKESK